LAELQRLCVGLDHSKNGQIVVVVVENLHGRTSIEALTQDLFDEWKIGFKNRDDGVIVLVNQASADLSQVRIGVGYGLEKGMPDRRLRDLLRAVWRSSARPSEALNEHLIEVTRRLVAMVEAEDANGNIREHELAKLKRSQSGN
jgi:uncharacterized membrane protein YgcG